MCHCKGGGENAKHIGRPLLRQADTVLYALGMKSVPYQELEAAAKAAGIPVHIIGDAIRPGKVDQATRTGYLAGVRIASMDNI